MVSIWRKICIRQFVTTGSNMNEFRYLQLDKQIKHADSYVLVSVFLFNEFI